MKTLIIAITVAASFLLAISHAQAATPVFFVSWQAQTYTPYFYEGRALPSRNSEIILTFEILANGRPVNISQKLVRWYVNNELYQAGAGLTTITIRTGQLKQDDYQIRISLPRYDANGDLENLFILPVVNPEAVIDTPYVNASLPAGTHLLRGLLYFFNTANPIQDINLLWTANGVAIGGRVGTPDILELKIPAALRGQSVIVSLTANNKKNELEFGNGSVNIDVK